jgi:hypothetical protein
MYRGCENDSTAGGYTFRHHPAPFDPHTQADEAFAFYQDNGYVVVDALSGREVEALIAASDDFVSSRGIEMDVPGQGQLFFPLLNYPECGPGPAANPRGGGGAGGDARPPRPHDFIRFLPTSHGVASPCASDGSDRPSAPWPTGTELSPQV